MPSGHTYKIEKDPDFTFTDFALSCARSMGACIMQRDNDSSEPPQVEIASTYHLDAQHAAEAKLRELETITPDALQALYNEEVSRIIEADLKSRAEWAFRKRAYAKMRARVKAWVPPSKDHENFKAFMLEQIDSSTRFSGYEKEEYGDEYASKPPVSPEAYKKQLVKLARENIVYHRDHYAEDVERAEKRGGWVKKLYESLGLPIPT